MASSQHYDCSIPLIRVYRFRCNECHMASYCSLECKKSDDVYHKYECCGYKMMLLPLLDAKLVLRLLLRGLMLMKRRVFNLAHCQWVIDALPLFDYWHTYCNRTSITLTELSAHTAPSAYTIHKIMIWLFARRSANNATDLFNVLVMEAHKDSSLDYFNIFAMDAKYEELSPSDFDYCTMVIYKAFTESIWHWMVITFFFIFVDVDCWRCRCAYRCISHI